ncbi:MAG: acyltransferase [Clostridiales bacterium]|nr:acyltransferase [Clostridiales bacterium]
MRKPYIDNLRNFTILLLFPVHTLMIWNDFGSRFYVWQGENRLLSTIIVLVNPWFMPLLFVLAGMSARYALEKRSVKEFMKQRIHKLGIPFLCGMIFLVPVQTLFARKFFDGYEGGMLENGKYFYTHLTDFSGYDGAFTPGHLWFILFLFLISLLSLMVFRLLPWEKAAEKLKKLPMAGMLLLFLPLWLMYYGGNFGGFSLGKSLALFLLGYYLLSHDEVMDRIEKSGKWLAALWGLGTVLSGIWYGWFAYYGDLWVNFFGWVSILALLALGRRFLNRRTRLTGYLNDLSYPLYLLHQPILVTLAYYMAQTDAAWPVQALCIGVGSLILTVAACHVMRRIPVVRRMIGVR